MATVRFSARGLRILKRDLHHLWLLTNRSQLDEEAAQTAVVQFLAVAMPASSRSVAFLQDATIAVGEDGKLSAFGWANFELPPVPFISVHAGAWHLCALRRNGELICTGEIELNMPEELGSVVAVTSGYQHACAVKATGELVCFGDNCKG